MPEASRTRADASDRPAGSADAPPTTAAAGSVAALRPSSPAVRARFSRQRTRDTKPELALRRLLHARGLRYRVDAAPLPDLRRRADVVFTRVRLAVFVDGCFWHRCPRHGTSPENNADWWREKLDRNVQRDRDTDRTLTEAGWQVLRFWEHEPPEHVADQVHTAWTTRRAELHPPGTHTTDSPQPASVRPPRDRSPDSLED